MPHEPHSPLQGRPPHVQLIALGLSQIVSNVVYVAAEIGLADHLASAPKSAVELADAMRVHAPSLHRLMRCLASLGILAEQPQQRFALTGLGEALQSGAPGLARSCLRFFGSAAAWSAWGNLADAVRTGRPGFETAHGEPFFDYLAHHADDGSLFSQAMMGLHGQEPPAVAAAYDFSGFRTVVDVGGGTGNMLAAVLAKHPGPRGILFDRPHVVTDASAVLAAGGVSHRVTVEAGDFFENVPIGADAYILSHIIHDWSENCCLTILGHVRRALHETGRLLLIEMVLPPGEMPHPAKMLDMAMLVLTGGQERTEAEYASLLAKAGLRLTRVVPTSSNASVIEAVAG